MNVEATVESGSSSTSHSGKPYSQLDGGRGREVHFRSDRYSSRDLGGVDVALSFGGADGERHHGALYDVSQTGVAFLPSDGFRLAEGNVLQDFLVTFDGYIAYEGGVQVRTVRSDAERTIVGVAFLDSLLNIEDVLKMRDVKAAHRSSRNEIDLATASWRVPGNSEFKASIAELSLYLRAAQEGFAKLERSVPWEDIHGGEDNPVVQQLLAMLDSGFCREYVAWLGALNEYYLRLEPAHGDGIKAYARALLHPYILEAPVISRCYEKPLGYAGDYVVMTYLYWRRFEGHSLFAKAVHRASCWQEGSVAVRQRKDLLCDRIITKIRAQAGRSTAPVRILSVAAGPAQELYELLQGRDLPDVPIEFVLFDQDKQALTLAQTRLLSILQRRKLSTVSFQFVNDSIKSFLKGQSTVGEQGRFDIIYTAGLFDYLREDLGARLCSWFAGNLAEDGICYIGNFSTRNPSRWSMEHLYEWYLLHRTEEDMLRIAEMAGIRGSPRIEQEPSGLNLFLAFQRG